MRAFILSALLACPAGAETGHSLVSSRMSLEGPTAQCFAVVVIVNRVGVYNRDETLETDHGAVVEHYETVGGHNAVDADQVQVMALPDGVTAVPMHMALPDGETGRVCLMEHLGF